MSKHEIIVEGKHLHLVLGKTTTEWEIACSDSPDLWSIPFEELINGALEINETIWYWYIDGRCYETTESVA